MPAEDLVCPQTLTAREVADYLRISYTTAARLLERGEIPGRHVGGQWRTHIKDLEHYLHVPDTPEPTWRPFTRRAHETLVRACAEMADDLTEERPHVEPTGH